VYQNAMIGLHAMWNEHFGIGNFAFTVYNMFPL
jgi:hypothetical protein